MFLSCWHVMVRTLTHCCVLTCSWCGEGSLTFLMFLCRGTGVITSTVKVASQRWRTGCLETSTLWPSSSSSSLCCRYSLIHALHQYWYCINTASILILYQYCINTDWFVLVFTGLFWFLLVCAGMCCCSCTWCVCVRWWGYTWPGLWSLTSKRSNSATKVTPAEGGV